MKEGLRWAREARSCGAAKARTGAAWAGHARAGFLNRPDRRGNLYPAKQRPEQEIDAAVALMMAVGRAMAEETSEGDLEDFLRNPVIA